VPLTNGHDVEPGCYGDGANRGWYIGDHVIDIALSFGWELDDEGRAAVERYYRSDPGEAGEIEYADAADIVASQGGIIDEAIDWLNDHTPPICPRCGSAAYWEDGDWYHEDLNDRDDVWDRRFCHGDDAVDENYLAQPQSYVWHFHDGSFFLSPLCEDGDCDDETCAHWD
jgi:hypothetical protein